MQKQRPIMSKSQNICLILELILFVLLGMVIINKFVFKDKEIKNNDSILKTLAALNINGLNTNKDLINNLYQDECTFKNLNFADQLYLTLKYLDEEINDNYEISLKDLKNKMGSLFSNMDTINNDFDIKTLFTNQRLVNEYIFKINDEKVNITKKEVEPDYIILNKYLKIYDNKENIKVVMALSFGKTKGAKMILYKDVDLNNQIEERLLVESRDLDWQKYYHYEIYLQKDKNNYSLAKIKLVK